MFQLDSSKKKIVLVWARVFYVEQEFYGRLPSLSFVSILLALFISISILHGTSGTRAQMCIQHLPPLLSWSSA